MSKKKALIITTKNWSENEIQDLGQVMSNKNYRWRANVLTKDGKKKFCYFYSKIDLEIMAIQVGFKILKVAKI